MGKDLTTMIEEINDASASISKTSKADDPVSLFDSISKRWANNSSFRKSCVSSMGICHCFRLSTSRHRPYRLKSLRRKRREKGWELECRTVLGMMPWKTSTVHIWAEVSGKSWDSSLRSWWNVDHMDNPNSPTICAVTSHSMIV